MSGPMGLVLPVPGDTQDTWGVALNTAMGLVENHDHTTGKGSLIPSAALNVNADTPWHSYAITGAKAFGFTEQPSASMTGYTDAFFVDSTSHNLFFRNSGGTNVRITNGNSLDVSGVGGIGGDYAATGALESYDAATTRYLFQGPGPSRAWSGIAGGDLQLYQKAASIVNSVTLKSPNALAASYTVTWPAAVPAASAFVMASTAGTLTFPTSPVLSNNATIQFQGTGHALRGNRTIRCLVRHTISANISGSPAGTPSIGIAGAQVAVNSSNTFFVSPETTDFALMTITSVTVWAMASGGSVTFSLQEGTGAGNMVTIAGASASSSSLTQYSPITLTPTTPYVVGTGVSLIGSYFGLNVLTASGAIAAVLAIDFNTTVTT